MRNLFALLVYLFIAQYAAASDGPEAEQGESFGFVTERNVPYVSIEIGSDISTEQMLDVYRPEKADLSPVILYVHAGGWAYGDKKDVNLKPHFFTAQGFAFVSMNYRLRWDHEVYDQVVDVVTALSWIEREGAEHGLDSSRIVLMGHQAGGHLVSLAMTDGSYLKGEGMSGDNVKAVVSIDSSSYDVTRLMRELGSFVERRMHQVIFGSEEEVWQAASPITHVASRDSLPAFALLFNPENEPSMLQAKGFAKELAASDVEVIMIPGSGEAPDRTDELLGTAGNLSTVALMAFLRAQI